MKSTWKFLGRNISTETRIVHANLHLQEVDLLEGDEEVPPSPKALVQASLPKERASKRI